MAALNTDVDLTTRDVAGLTSADALTAHSTALDPFDKPHVNFDNARFTGAFFRNRGLFSGDSLRERLKDDAAWRDNPSSVFHRARELFQGTQNRFLSQSRAEIDQGLLKPVFQLLGFLPAPRTGRDATDESEPEYVLKDPTGTRTLCAAFTYPWGRWLDGPDFQDPDRPDENPGARVVAAIEDGLTDWAIVTNGRWWRLYSRQAHARATRFYEVDLVAAWNVSGQTDPNAAFRYWWLFFRATAYEKTGDGRACWLDGILQASRESAKRLGDRLKERVFLDIVPQLAEGFLADRCERLTIRGKPTPEELSDVYEATLRLLYRLLFLLYAESRDLLPVREGSYGEASLETIQEEIAAAAGVALSESDACIEKAYSPRETTLYDRLGILFQAIDKGNPVLNVPTYHGGLFNTSPESFDDWDHRIARFLCDHKVPDCFLARAIDRLARDQDETTLGLVFIDYKSLEVRNLGSIYEGLMEFTLEVAEEDLTTQTEKNQETYIPLSQARPRRGRPAEVVVKKGEVYLSNDKASRKASGAYYTPDPIVESLVAQTVGPILDEKLEALRPEFRKVRKTFENEWQKATACPPTGVSPQDRAKLRSFAIEKTYHTHKDLVERLFDITVLDPAMGSGHFLVEAVDSITDTLLQFLSAFPVNPVTVQLEQTRASILESLSNQGVTVARDQLTDINLLKRHVLKRCVYGVNLNPMAVELAKMSLWLDAFALGTPLNFLDHHLRCGNSLVGATLRDTETATGGRLLGLDDETLGRWGVLSPLRGAEDRRGVSLHRPGARAAGYDLTPLRSFPDSLSVNQYAQARKSLSGYQIVLDRLCAGYAGMGDKEKARGAEVATLAKQAARCFFHWEVEFPEVFFGLAEGTTELIRHKDRMAPGSAGFDCVVGNPPYDVLAEKELETNLEELLGFFKNAPSYQPARGGKQNLYKLFICRGIHVLREGGRLGQIVPMALLGDEQAAGVRKMLLTNCSMAAVEAFPQKDDPRNRVFEDAKLSTCIFVAVKKNEDAPFRSRVHPGKTIEPGSPALIVRRSQVKLYDPENQPILACSQEDWDLAVRMMNSGRMKRLGASCVAYQGEVNETTDGRKGHLSRTEGDGPRILRGANVCRYVLRKASQGEAIFLRKDQYLRGKRLDAKAWHHKQARVAFQRTSPQNNFRRLIACYLPAGHFCCDTISYFPSRESKMPLSFIVGLLNSQLLDWYFRLGSTNSKVNDYQVRSLPVPRFADGEADAAFVRRFENSVENRDDEAGFSQIQAHTVNPPFPQSVCTCLTVLVERIVRIETERGEIARADRSELAADAQPIQRLIDRILFRLAGLTDAEAAGLEQRLSKML